MISKIDPNDLTLKQLFDQYKQSSKAGSVTQTGASQPMTRAGNQTSDQLNQSNAFDATDSDESKEKILGDLNQLLISVVDDIE